MSEIKPQPSKPLVYFANLLLGSIGADKTILWFNNLVNGENRDLFTATSNKTWIVPYVPGLVSIILYIVVLILMIRQQGLPANARSNKLINALFPIATFAAILSLTLSFMAVIPMQLTLLFDLEPGHWLYVGPEEGWEVKDEPWWASTFFVLMCLASIAVSMSFGTFFSYMYVGLTEGYAA